MDQERNMFDSQGQEAMQEGVVDGEAAAEAIEDEEAQAIVAEAELEKSKIESELAEVDRRLDLEYTMLGKRAFQFAQTDAELASRLGVALAAVTAQTERRVRLSRSLEAMEKKTADRLIDLKRAREAQESARMSEEDLVRKEEAAREAMERARLLEQEAEQARHVRESALHEADAAALAASRTMLISFTDDAPMVPEAFVASIASEEPESPEMPELSEASEAPISAQDADTGLDESSIWDANDSEALEAVDEARQCDTEDVAATPQEAPVVEEDFASDLSPALQAMFAPVSLTESEPEIQGEPESAEGSEQQEGEGLADEFAPTPEAEAGAEDKTEPEAELATEETIESATDSDAELEAEPEAGTSWGFTPAPATAPQPEPKRDPNATLLLSDYDDQSAEPGFAAQPINPEATLLLDDDIDIAEEKSATCPSCGFEVQQGDKFCLKCGSKLELPEPEQSAAVDVQPESVPEAVLAKPSRDEGPAFDESSNAVPPEGNLEHIPAHAHYAANVSEPPAAPAPSMRCCACGAQIQLGDKFCMRCGARQEQPVAAPAAPAPAASAPICMNCGLELNAGDKFCMRCGTPVQQVPTPQAPQVPVARLCPHCGAEYSETDKFCMMCGTPL